MRSRTERTIYAITAFLILLGVVNGFCNSAYSLYMVFYVLAPEGTIGPLFGAAAELLKTEEGFNTFMARRLYSREGWQSGMLSLLLIPVGMYCWQQARKSSDDAKTDGSLP